MIGEELSGLSGREDRGDRVRARGIADDVAESRGVGVNKRH
jgi:hypothetical protein